MKKGIGRLILTVLVIGFICFEGVNLPGVDEGVAAEPGPVVAVGTPLVKRGDITGIVIMGTGFRPAQEIRLLFTTVDGQQSDIGYALKPEPKPDKTGSWFTTWDASSFVKEKLVTGGAYKLCVADGDYRIITHTPVFFQPEKDKEDKNKK